MNVGQTGLFLPFSIKLVPLVWVLFVLIHSFRGLLGRGAFSDMHFHDEIFTAQASSGYMTYFCLLELFT